MSATDSQTLLDQAKCYMCLGITLAEALQLALLAQIATGGSSGTNVQQTYSTIDANPNTAGILPVNQTIGNWFYQDPSVGVLNVWYWSVANHTWVQYSG